MDGWIPVSQITCGGPIWRRKRRAPSDSGHVLPIEATQYIPSLDDETSGLSNCKLAFSRQHVDEGTGGGISAS